MKAIGAVFLMWFVIGVVVGIGWVMNIVAIIHADFSHVTGVLVVRCVGIVLPPLGAFMGYFA